MSTATFETWGTFVFLGTRDPAETATAGRLATRVLADIGRACSRFREDSDLTRANAHPGQWVEVDPLLVAAVSVACAAAAQTDGLVNPLLGRPLVQLGYDRDFQVFTECEEEITQPTPRPADVAAAPDADAWQRIGLDPTGAIRVPAGTALDLGATAKAWAADVIAAAFASELTGSALVSVGGDLAVASPDGEPWTVAISELPGAAPDQSVALHGGGLATSSTRVRRWRRGGVERHHLLDPCTGLPVSDARRTATATGPSCTAANTASTAAVVLGEGAEDWLEAREVAARLVDARGTVHTTGGWPVDPQPRRYACPTDRSCGTSTGVRASCSWCSSPPLWCSASWRHTPGPVAGYRAS